MLYFSVRFFCPLLLFFGFKCFSIQLITKQRAKVLQHTELFLCNFFRELFFYGERNTGKKQITCHRLQYKSRQTQKKSRRSFFYLYLYGMCVHIFFVVSLKNVRARIFFQLFFIGWNFSAISLTANSNMHPHSAHNIHTRKATSDMYVMVFGYYSLVGYCLSVFYSIYLFILSLFARFLFTNALFSADFLSLTLPLILFV